MKTYRKKVTALLTAIENLSGLLDSDLSAVEDWGDEIKELHKAVRDLNQEETPPVFVTVRSGVVTLVADEAGEPHENPVIIDHDTLENGDCPVCESGMEDGHPCEVCGFDPEKDNALQCAVTYYSGSDTTLFEREMSTPLTDEQDS